MCVLFCFSAPTSCLLTPLFWMTAQTMDCMATSCMSTCTARAFSACAVPSAASSPPKVTLTVFLFQHGLKGLEGTRDQLPCLSSGLSSSPVTLSVRTLCSQAPAPLRDSPAQAVSFVPICLLLLLHNLPSPLLWTPSVLFCTAPHAPPPLPPFSLRGIG